MLKKFQLLKPETNVINFMGAEKCDLNFGILTRDTCVTKVVEV
jgi:hypothetical protein